MKITSYTKAFKIAAVINGATHVINYVIIANWDI